MGQGADGYLTTLQAAEFLAMSDRTLVDWRCRGEGPPYARFGRKVNYLRSDLEAWAMSRRIGTALISA